MITVPEFSMPGPLASLGRSLPQWPHALALATALNAANRREVFGEAEREALAGRVVRIRVQDAGICASVVFRDGRFRVAPAGAEAALCFTANASAYLQMLARQEDPDTLFFHRRLLVEGDTDLGLLVKNLLDRVELPGWLSSRLQSQT
ncbi:MAG TPA: SCP2 sterol-binding domain-containing protein [Quisquiliibacterium sp.]|nr:SCP2 sterol-binding domain-containing protein [Quisquiliibacterium sp.]